MSKIINLLVCKYSLTLYKRTLALLLAFVMLFNLSSEVFASALQARADIEKMKEVSSQLKQALSEEFAEKDLKESEVPCNTPESCYQKALLEYGKAAKDYSDFSNAVIRLYKSLHSLNEYTLKEYTKEQAALQAQLDAFNEQINLFDGDMETYNKQTGDYIAWKLQKPLMEQRNILEQEILNKLDGSANQTVYDRILNNNKATTDFLKQEEKWKDYESLWQTMDQKDAALKTEFDKLEQKSDKLDKDIALVSKQNEQINDSYNQEVDRILGAEGSIYKITPNTNLEVFSQLVSAKLDKMYAHYEQTKKTYEQAYEKYLDLQLKEYKEDLVKFTNSLQERCLAAQQEYEQRKNGESALNKPWQVLNQEKRVYKECIAPVITKNDFSSLTGKRLTYEDFKAIKYLEYYETYVPANHKGWTFDGKRRIWAWKPDINKIAKEKAAKIMALLLISGTLGTQALISMQQEEAQAAALNSKNSSEIEIIDEEPEALPKSIQNNKTDESRGEILAYFDRIDKKTQDKQDALFRVVEVINKQAQKELKAIYNPVMLRVAKGENTEAIIASLGINPSYFKSLIENLLKAEGEDSASLRQEIAASGKQYSKQYIEALLRSQEEEAKRHKTTAQKAGKAGSIALDVLFFWLPSTYISKKMEKKDAEKARNNFISAYPIEASQILQNLLKIHAMYFSTGSQAVEAWNQVATVVKNKKADTTLKYMRDLADAMGGETSNTELSANIREQHRKAVASAQEERKMEDFSSDLIFLFLIDTVAMLFMGVISAVILPNVIAKVCTVTRGLRYLNLEQRIIQRALKNIFAKMDAATLRKYKTALGELENLNNLNFTKSNLSSVKSYVQANRQVLKVSQGIMEEALKIAKKGGTFGRSARYEKAIANFESLMKEQKQISEYLTQLNNATQKGSKVFGEIEKNSKLFAKIEKLSQNPVLKEYNQALSAYNASLSVDIYGNITQTGNLQAPKKTKELARIEKQITNLSGKLDKVSPETQNFLKAQAKAEQSSKKLSKFYKQTEESSAILAKGKTKPQKVKTKKVKIDNNAVNTTASPDEGRVLGQMNEQLHRKQSAIKYHKFTFLQDLKIRLILNENLNLISKTVQGVGSLSTKPKYAFGLTSPVAMGVETPFLVSQSVVEASQASKAVKTLPVTLEAFNMAKPITVNNLQTLRTAPLSLGTFNGGITASWFAYGGSVLPMGTSALLGNLIHFTGFAAYDKRWDRLGLSKQKERGVIDANEIWWNKATTQAYNNQVNTIQEKVLARYQQEALDLIKANRPLPANANLAMQKVYSEVQTRVNLNTLWWIYGNSVEEVFLPYEKEATSTTGIAAGLFIPMPKWLLGYLTGSKTVSKLSAEDIKKLKGAVTEAFKEASEKYISSYKGAQERINQTTVIQDENFVNILKESIAQKINLVDIRVDSIKKELIANLNNRIERMKDGEVVAVKRASFISTKDALQEYANKYGQEAINNIEQATYLQDKRFVEIFISKLQKNLEKTQLSASRQDQYRQTFAEKLNYVAAKKSKEEISQEAAILKNISAAYGASIDGIKKPGTVVLVNHRGLVLGLMQSPVADDYLNREVNLLREGKTVASGKIVNYDENLGLSVIFIDKADNLQTSYTFATEKLVPNKTLYLNSYSYNNGKSLVQANQFDKQDSKTGFLNLKEAPKQEQTGAAIIDEEGNLYGLASASNNSVDVKSLRPFLTKAVWTILTNTELRNQAMRNYPGFVESYQNIFDAIKTKNLSVLHIPETLFRPASYMYNINGREGQIPVNNHKKPAPKQGTKKVEIRTEDQLLVHSEMNAVTEKIISELEPNATNPNVRKEIETFVADFRQKLKDLYNKVFPKYNSGKLFGLFLPITATFIMQLAKLVQDIKDRIPAMKKAFKNAEERTLNVLLFADNEMAKDLFLGYLEEELVLENFSRGKIDEFLQITDNYLREQLNTKETIQDNKQSTEVETSQKIQESITFDTMTAEEMIKADPQGIMAELDKALYINNTDSKAYYYRAKAKAELQDYQGALEDFQTAFDLEPSNKKYAKALEEAKAKLQQQIKPSLVTLQDMTVDNFINDMEAQLPANLTQEQMQAIDSIRREAQALRRLESLPRVIDKITLLQETLRLTLIAKPVLNVNGSNSETNFDFLKANKEDIIDVAVESNEKANSMLHSHLLPDFYDRFAFYIKTLANSHKEFSIVLNMHGGQKGEILAVEKTTISDILDLIKANSSDSTVNIITTSCHGQAGDSAFTDKVLNYGFNYLGITGRNDSFFNSDLQSLFNYDLPTAFVNSITLGYFGAVLIYKGKVYRALDIAKEQYKDNTEKIKEIELLQEYYFGQDPVKAMKELGKMERYTLKYDGIPALRSLENIQSTKKLPNIKPPKEFTQVNRTVVFGYPFALINLEKDKIFLLSAPISKIKTDFLKASKQVFKGDNINIIQKDLITARGNYSSNIGAGFFEEIYKAVPAFNFNPYFGQVALPFLSSYHNTQDNSFEVHDGQNTSARQPTEEKTKTNTFAQPYTSILAVFRDLSKHSYLYQKPEIPVQNNTNQSISNEGAPVNEVKPQQNLKEEKGFYDDTLEFNLLDQASRLRISLAGQDIGVSRAQKLFANMDFNSMEEVRRLYRAFIAEVKLIKNLMALEEKGYENLTEKEKLKFDENFKKTVSIRKALANIVFTLNLSDSFPRDFFEKMRDALMTVDPGTRVYFTSKKENKKDSSDVEDKINFYRPDTSQDHLYTDISDLVIVVMNDEPSIVSYIADNLSQYSNNVFKATTIYQLKNLLEDLKQKGLRPHYFINDMHLGQTVSGSDAMRVVKQTFPEIANNIGFIMWSDSSGLGDYLHENNYIGHVKRVEGENSTSSVKHPAFYLSYIESKEHIADKINQIPVAGQQVPQRVFDQETWQNLAAKDINEIARLFEINNKEIILVDLSGLIMKPAVDKIKQEAQKNGFTIKEVKTIEEIGILNFTDKKLIFGNIFSYDKKDKLFQVKKDSPVIWVDYEDLDLSQKQDFFAEGYEGYYYVKREKKINSDNKIRPTNQFKPMATPRVIRRPGNFGSIFMPIILTTNPIKSKRISSSQTKYTSPYLSFFKQEYDFFDNPIILDRAIYSLMNSEKNFIREIKWSPSANAQINKEKAFYNAEDFVERTKFEQIYNIENPGDYTILLVQDDKNCLARAAETLREKGFKVFTASDGFMAQTMLEDFNKEGVPLHFLITDDTLPVRDGAELAKFVSQNSMDTIVVGFSDSVIDAQKRYKKGFDFSFSTYENEIENIANFLPYLIQKYGFKGSPKKQDVKTEDQTYYLDQNSTLMIDAQVSQSTQAEQANLVTEIKEDKNPLLFLNTPTDTPTSLATFLAFAPIVVSKKIKASLSNGKIKTKRKHKNIPLYYTKDIKNGEEIPLNLHIQVSPRLEMPAKCDKIIFDEKGIAYYSGPEKTKVISHFYMEVPNKPYDLKLLIGAIRKSKLASPFEIKFTASNYDNKHFSRVLLYDAKYNVLNINILLPKDFLKADEGIQFSNGAFYLFNKKTLTRIVKLENIKIRVPKKQIPNLTEVFLNSESRPTLYFVPNFDKASVVYRTSMFTNVSLGKTFGPIAKKELGVTETSSSGIMLGIQYGIPLLSLAIQPRVRAWGEKKTLLIALSLSLAAGTMAALAGFNGISPDVPRTLLQKGIFITAFAFMSFSTLLRQLVSTILIGDNSGVVKETDPRATINHKQTSDENTGEEIKKERFSIINFIKKNTKTEKNIYSIPLELVLSKAFVFKSIGTLVFLTFPFMLNKLIYWLSFKTMQPNFDYSLSFPLFALVSAIGIIKTYRTNLRDRSPSLDEEDTIKEEVKAKENKSVKERYQDKVKKVKEKHQNRVKKVKENISKAKSEAERKAWIKENGKIVRYFLTLVFANTHEFVVSSALASQLSSIFTDSATSNFYIALGLYAPLLLGRWLFNKVRGKTSSGTSFAVFMGLSLLGTLMMVFNPTSQLMLMLGAGIASLGMGNCFTLFYTHVTKQYSKEKELTISSLGSIAVAASAVLTMVSPKLIESGHFQASLIYGLAMIIAVTLLGLPVMQDSPIMKILKDIFNINSRTSDTKQDTSFKTKKREFFSDLGKWWHYPKNGTDMNNPTPQN